MPDEGMTGAGAPPMGGAPAQPQGGPPGQPQDPSQASGPGGASMPTPNRGLEAAALAKLAVYVQGMQTILAVMPAGSDAARDIRDALNKVAKHVPPGAVSQGVQMSSAQRDLMQQKQMGPQIAAMRASQPAMPQQGSPPPQMAA